MVGGIQIIAPQDMLPDGITSMVNGIILTRMTG